MCGYARRSDYVTGISAAAAGPALMLLWERVAPSHVGKGGFASIMRLTGLVGLGGGFGLFYSRSIRMQCHVQLLNHNANDAELAQSVFMASPRISER